MQLISLDLDKYVSLEAKYAIALGFFDGVHLGHQQLINKAVRYARDHHIKSAVMTFDIDPWLVLNRIDSEQLLTPLDKRIELFESLGIETVFVLHFTLDVARMNPALFIEHFMTQMNPEYIVCGQDFKFGTRGEGNASLLKTSLSNTVVEVEPLLTMKNQKIGTSQIIEALETGDVYKAKSMLSRPYSITGKVIHGNQRGRQIGYNTANMDYNSYVLPKRGVYFVQVEHDKKQYFGMCNIGYNPTFNQRDHYSLEVHIFDFNEDIYGEVLTVSFIDFIRDEKKFDSMEDLKNQLAQDRLCCLEKEKVYDPNEPLNH